MSVKTFTNLWVSSGPNSWVGMVMVGGLETVNGKLYSVHQVRCTLTRSDTLS